MSFQLFTSVLYHAKYCRHISRGFRTKSRRGYSKTIQKINDKTILEYSLEKFNSAPSIDEITVVIHPEWRQECEHILSDCRISKVKHLLDGGKERYHSVLAALKFYAGRPCNLLIHDAVRPLVSQRIIEEVITELQTYKAVNVAYPATDTIIEVDPTHAYVSRIPDRNILYQVQTPQGFHNQTLQEAYALALKDPALKRPMTCSVVKKYLPQEENQDR